MDLEAPFNPVDYLVIEKDVPRPACEMVQTQVPPPNYADALWCTYLVSVAAASVAEFLTYPLDLTKTRLQIQGEVAAQSNGNPTVNCQKPLERIKMKRNILKSPLSLSVIETMNSLIVKRGMLRTAVGIAQEEGVLKLWQGITPAIYRHVIYSGIRIVTYDYLRKSVLKKDPDGSFPVWKSAIGGVTSGAIAQFFASPADLVKVQIQMEGKRRLLGKPPRVRSPSHAFNKILAEGGLRGLWKGSIPNVQRAALVNLGDLTTYDTAKQFILSHTRLEDNHIVHMMSSACAGLVAATMGTPADVVKTRIMNQPTDVSGRGLIYKSSIDCLLKTVENEGIFALYKGFLPVWIRMAPWSLTFWLSFEHMRNVIGATAF